ncbi:MAG: HPF/RaiA family ribosome-associated protein [Burkholderiaceae bacterium]
MFDGIGRSSVKTTPTYDAGNHIRERMQILLNTDRNISNSPRLKDYVEAQVNDALGRFADRLTRIEVHLNDANSDKPGPNDKRCMMEARIRNHQPLSVTHETAEARPGGRRGEAN